MARPQKSRKLLSPPLMHGFKPFGIALCPRESIDLQLEEYESIRLVNYEGLSQEDAAISMEVSRPTLTRIYNSGLNKIAKAFVEGRIIRIQGGNYEFDKEWYKCKRCHKLIPGMENHIPCTGCKVFGDEELVPFKDSKL